MARAHTSIKVLGVGVSVELFEKPRLGRDVVEYVVVDLLIHRLFEE